ncbi:SRP68 [Candida pseudojiufengensis]|uniref:SRP68 n=1 Tax=Candida pseudojiufengensis TaxID=497109 RepID=UPI002224BDA1|nr:SRP68 [Candida pseudojiufengensis]KAI5961609.1 SRP68 [Candida pseudojiufengensis]
MESPLNTTLGARLSAYLVTAADYKRQRNRTNKKLLKLRHDLNIITKDTKNYKPPTITSEQYQDNNKYGLIELYLAERDVLYAHEIKAKLDVNNDKSSSYATLLKTKLKRALSHADNLIKLTEKSSAQIRIEVYIYASLIAGQLSINTKKWNKALNAYSIARCCLDYLKTKPENLDLSKELIENTVDPSLNLAASQLNLGNDLKSISRKYCRESNFPSISPALNLIDPSFTNEIPTTQLQKEIEWRGHTAEIYNDEVAYKIQELTNNKEWLKSNDTNQFDHIIAAWIEILELHKQDSEKNQDDDDLDQVQNRAILLTYLNYNLLFTKLKRDLLLIGQLITKDEFEEKRDIIKLYSGIINLVSELNELPGVYNDEDLSSSLHNLKQYFEFQKDTVIAEAYSYNSKYAESLKIYTYINDNLQDVREYYKVDFPFDVSTKEEVAFFKVHLKKRILQAQISSQFEANKKSACTKYAIENLNKYPEGINIFNLDEIRPIICKPVLFDIAFNYINYDGEIKTPIEKQPVKPTPNDEAEIKKSRFFSLFSK